MKRSLPSLLLLALAVGACTRVPDTVLEREEMARLMVDLELADAYASEQLMSSYASDSMRLLLRESVLAKHGVNEAKLDTSMRWYGRNLPKLQEVYDRMDSILADSLRALDMEIQAAMATASGDTIDVWQLPKSIVMTNGQQFVTFEIPCDTTWERGDVVQWDFAVHNNAKSHPITATIGASYCNRAKSIDAQTKKSEHGQNVSITLQLDRQKQAEHLFGYIQLPIDSTERIFIDSISLKRTRMVENDYHQKRYRTRTYNRTHE